MRQLDTAAAYGESERRIGDYLRALGGSSQPFRISTKTPPALGADPETALRTLQLALERSRTALAPGAVDQLLLHRWEQRAAFDGAVWRVLRAELAADAPPVLGASLQSPAEVVQALGDPDVAAVQLACNVLDWRYETPALSALLESRAGALRIEVRSVFLQGLLSLPGRARYPDIGVPYDAEALSDFIAAAAGDHAGGDPVALCLRYAAGLEWATGLVVGVDTPHQLERIVEILAEGAFTPDVMQEIRARRPEVPEPLLDPARWR